MNNHHTNQLEIPRKNNKALGIVAIVLASVALLVALSSLGLSIYNTIRMPTSIKSYVNSHKDELRGPEGPIGPAGFNGLNGRNGSDGANGSNSSQSSHCTTTGIYNSLYTDCY